MAQHLWAVASHLLQYKSEESVPAPLRRSLSRVAALLELVDSELSRVRAEKRGYEETNPSDKNERSIMSLEEVKGALREVWPPENRSDDEEFEQLYSELLAFDVTSTSKLLSILHAERDPVLKYDEKMVRELSEDLDEDDEDAERLRSGVYFTHVGLTRIALQNHFRDHKFLKPLAYSPS